jgi:hypothetical protein
LLYSSYAARQIDMGAPLHVEIGDEVDLRCEVVDVCQGEDGGDYLRVRSVALVAAAAAVSVVFPASPEQVVQVVRRRFLADARKPG